MKTLKAKLLYLFIVLIPTLTFSQEEISKKDISNWILFPSGAPQFKKIDQDRFFAYYRTSLDDAGLMVFDKKLNVLKNINFKLTKNKKIFFNAKSFAELVAYPDYFYQEESNSIVILGYQKINKKKYTILSLTYSLDSESLEKIDTLKIVESANFDIRLSTKDKNFMIYEKLNPEKKVKGVKEYAFDIYNQKCEKIYSEKVNKANDAIAYPIVNEAGEFQYFEINENKKVTSFKTSKYDNKGKLIGNATLSMTIDDNYEYDSGGFVSISNQDFYVLYKKYDDIMEGIVILKLDYAKQKIQKIADYKIDENIVAKIYQSVNPSHAMTKNNKIKALDELKNFYIEKVFCDSTGFYVITNNLSVKSYVAQRHLESKFSSSDLIVWHFDLNGKIKWTTPIIKSADCLTWDTNTYIPYSSGLVSNYHMDENFIYMLVSSNKRLYATKIDKKTGSDIVPFTIFKDKEYYMNRNVIFFNDANNAIIATMEGIFLMWDKKVVTLRSIDLKF